MGVIVVGGTPAPISFAPTLVSPANGAYADLAASPTFVWLYNPGQLGLTQTGYLFTRVTNSTTTQWWNASAGGSWSTSPIWNLSSSSSLTFPSGSWLDGNTYTWAVATEDANGKGSSSQAFTVLSQSAPVVTLTSPLTGTDIATADPLITWFTTCAVGAVQTSYRLVIYTNAQYTAPGFTAGSGAAVFDTGIIGSSQATTLDLSVVPLYLTNSTTYRAYIVVTETGGQYSQWYYTQFTTAYVALVAPTVVATATTDMTTGCPLIQIAIQGLDNLITFTDSISPAGSGTGTWTAGPQTTLASGTFADGFGISLTAQ